MNICSTAARDIAGTRAPNSPYMALALTRLLSFSFFFLCLAPIAVRGSALTTAIAANERLCFYADVDKAGEKIGVSSTFFFVPSFLRKFNPTPSIVLLCGTYRARLRVFMSSLFLFSPSRSNPEDRSISTLTSKTQTTKSSSMAPESDRATLSSQPTPWANIRSASRTTCQRSPKNSSISISWSKANPAERLP